MASFDANSEDAHRSADQAIRLVARQQGKRLRLAWLLLGPGILVMLGENDAPSMLSYAATGAKFGIGFYLPFILLTFVMALVVQETAMRLGAVTHLGHAELIHRRFGRLWGTFALIDLLLTNALTLVTEFIGIVAGAEYFHSPPLLAVLATLGILTITVSARRYWRWERLMLVLAFGNLAFIPVAVLTHPRWDTVIQALATGLAHPPHWSSQTLTFLLANIGATVTPWMLFFQQGAVSDKGMMAGDIAQGRLDTGVGAFAAALVGIFAVIATAPLARHHLNAGQYNAAQFAQALRPYAGRWGGRLFALGIIESGLVAAEAIATSSAYTFGEITGVHHSLNRPWREAPGFYALMGGIAAVSAGLVLVPGFPLESLVLIVNVLAVLTMPPALAFLLLLANDPDLMGSHRNRLYQNVLGIAVTALLSFAGILYAISVVAPTLR
ncbi:MAG: divalent metal cation transporter [Firmicutes bacterium]|nr:divalent metal cation transporter [Bacillota bacterium]